MLRRFSRERRNSDSDLYIRMEDNDARRGCLSVGLGSKKKSKGASGIVVRTDEILNGVRDETGIRSPRRESVPFNLDANQFIKNAEPVQYYYPDSPDNTRMRKPAGIEKQHGVILGIPASMQYLGADGERLISEDNMNVCLVACIKHLLERIEDLEECVKELRNPANGGWSVEVIWFRPQEAMSLEGIARSAANKILRRTNDEEPKDRI